MKIINSIYVSMASCVKIHDQGNIYVYIYIYVHYLPKKWMTKKLYTRSCHLNIDVYTCMYKRMYIFPRYICKSMSIPYSLFIFNFLCVIHVGYNEVGKTVMFVKVIWTLYGHDHE